MKKIAFAGGGSGGHIYPILAIHENLKNYKEFDFFYFVCKSKLEDNKALEANIKREYISFIGGMPRSWKIIFWIFKLFFATIEACYILKKQKPDLIFSTGGYASASILLAANLFKIPYIIHNLDSIMGLSNKIFAKNSNCLSFGLEPKTIIKTKNAPIILSGNPIRQEFFNEISKEIACKDFGLDFNKKILTITGGSQGSQIINNIILDCIEELIANNWQIVHQLGEKEFQRLKNQINNLTEKYFNNYKAFSYIDKIALLYSATDLIIGRAGAMTLAEICAKKIPSIIIPLPNLAQNHQFYNASILASKDYCFLLEQKDLTVNNLITAINKITEKKEVYLKNLEVKFKEKNAVITISNIIKSFFN